MPYKGGMKMKKRRISANEVMESRYYQLPKFIIHEKEFKGLSLAAKVLYAIMRDRHDLSLKNGWIDKEGNVFMYYSRQNMMEDLQAADKTVTKAVKELIKYELIDEVRQGLNKPNIIYVMTVDVDSQWTRNIYESGIVKSTNPGVVKSTNQEPKILRPNDTEFKETEIKETNNKKDNMSITTNSKIDEVITYLNEKSGKNFRTSTKTYRETIGARLKEDYTVDQMKEVIEYKCKEWLGDSKTEKWVNPDTLFRPSNFDKYLNQVPVKQVKVKDDKEADEMFWYNGKRTKYTKDYIKSLAWQEWDEKLNKHVWVGRNENNLNEWGVLDIE